jgi:hypothetical protein
MNSIIEKIQKDIRDLNTKICCTQKQFYVSILFETISPFTYIAPNAMVIVSVSNPDALTYTITKNGVAYTLGTPIAQYDTIVVIVDGLGYIKLNCTL